MIDSMKENTSYYLTNLFFREVNSHVHSVYLYTYRHGMSINPYVHRNKVINSEYTGDRKLFLPFITLNVIARLDLTN